VYLKVANPAFTSEICPEKARVEPGIDEVNVSPVVVDMDKVPEVTTSFTGTVALTSPDTVMPDIRVATLASTVLEVGALRVGSTA